jgi:hypothetical protein
MSLVGYGCFGKTVGPIHNSKAVKEETVLEQGIDRLFRNVDNKLPTYAS